MFLKIALRPVQGDKRPFERIELRGSTRRYRPTSTARPARGGLNRSLDVRTKPAEYTVRFRCCSTKLINLRRHARGDAVALADAEIAIRLFASVALARDTLA